MEKVLAGEASNHCFGIGMLANDNGKGLGWRRQ